jgi:hypothetical protein
MSADVAVVATEPVAVPVPANAGQPWSEEEIGKLLAAVQQKLPFPEIATAHQRTIGGVVAQLKKVAYHALKVDNKTMEEVLALTCLKEAQVQKALDVRDPAKKAEKKAARTPVPVKVAPAGSVQAQLTEIKALLVRVLVALKA